MHTYPHRVMTKLPIYYSVMDAEDTQTLKNAMKLKGQGNHHTQTLDSIAEADGAREEKGKGEGEGEGENGGESKEEEVKAGNESSHTDSVGADTTTTSTTTTTTNNNNNSSSIKSTGLPSFQHKLSINEFGRLKFYRSGTILYCVVLY
jgi:hypothetical protein